MNDKLPRGIVLTSNLKIRGVLCCCYLSYNLDIIGNVIHLPHPRYRRRSLYAHETGGEGKQCCLNSSRLALLSLQVKQTMITAERRLTSVLWSEAFLNIILQLFSRIEAHMKHLTVPGRKTVPLAINSQS